MWRFNHVCLTKEAPMQNNSTTFKKINSVKLFHPSRTVVSNILNYSRRTQMLFIAGGKTLLWSNN